MGESNNTAANYIWGLLSFSYVFGPEVAYVSYLALVSILKRPLLTDPKLVLSIFLAYFPVFIVSSIAYPDEVYLLLLPTVCYDDD